MAVQTEPEPNPEPEPATCEAGTQTAAVLQTTSRSAGVQTDTETIITDEAQTSTLQEEEDEDNETFSPLQTRGQRQAYWHASSAQRRPLQDSGNLPTYSHFSRSDELRRGGEPRSRDFWIQH